MAGPTTAGRRDVLLLERLDRYEPGFLGRPEHSDLVPLDISTPLKSSLFDAGFVATQKEGFFKLPALEPTGQSVDHEESTVDTQTTDDVTAETDPESDFWIDLDALAQKAPALPTWESFIKGTPASPQLPLLTEAGAAAYDALLSWPVDPLGLKNTDVPVVESGAYFASLLALALGRESLLFFKDDGGKSFKPALSNMRISGHSVNVLQGIEKQCLTCGTRLLELRGFVQNTYSKNASRCGVALASALDEILQAIESNTVAHGSNPRSLLQLQAIIKGISAVLAPFHRLTSKLRPNTSDEEILSLVFDQASSLENSETWLCEIMQEVLRRVSRPWTEFLEEWIGTKREEGIPFNKSSIGQRKGFVKVEPEFYTDDFGEQIEEIDFRLDQTRLPHFMPDDVAQTVFETGRNLRFIRASHPDHPLAQPDVVESGSPPPLHWLYDWDAILRLESRVADYRDRLLDSIDECRADNPSSKAAAVPVGTVGRPAPSLFTLDEEHMEAHIQASIDHFNGPMLIQEQESSLGRIIRQRLGSRSQLDDLVPRTQPHWSLLSALSFGGIVSAQAQVVNREALRLLFRSHDLRGHLKLQRDFHLFGNGMFSSRLAHALFDPDLERADRQAGVARQGGIMGLRLGGRDTWPPASSELRLALMGVLSETYETQNRPGGSSDLPGDLSFAVRDLPEEEIDKCMNPDSLEALDFLRLSYKAPPELSFILTPTILMQYDRIFRLLLRVLRMHYVVDQLWRDVMTRGDEASNVSYRFVREARHFVSSVASYFLDIGVALPWQVFEDKLDKIQASLDTRIAEKLESPRQLREFHAQVLNAIMLALFLRKRQQPVLKLLEEVFAIVLEYAKSARLRKPGTEEDADNDASKLYGRFKKKLQVFLTVCRGLTEKARIGGTREDKGLGLDGIGDESMVSRLLVKLDPNGYYSKH